MAIPERCNRILDLVNRVKRYDTIVRGDSFTNDAMREIKENCRDILKEADSELRKIWEEVNHW